MAKEPTHSRDDADLCPALHPIPARGAECAQCVEALSAAAPRAAPETTPEPKPVTYRDLPPDLKAVWLGTLAGVIGHSGAHPFLERTAKLDDLSWAGNLLFDRAETAAWEAVRRANGGVPFNVEHDERTCEHCLRGFKEACAANRRRGG